MLVLIRIDGYAARVRIRYNTLKRSFSFVEGQNGGTSLSGSTILDTIGTKRIYEFEVEPDPAYPDGYADFYDRITSPNRVHDFSITLDGHEIEWFAGMVISGTDIYGGTIAGNEKWHGLKVQVVPLAPQRRST